MGGGVPHDLTVTAPDEPWMALEGGGDPLSDLLDARWFRFEGDGQGGTCGG